jgi:ABC-type nitrate/sulfonate/bicarbonate transport system substrate-binding protein
MSHELTRRALLSATLVASCRRRAADEGIVKLGLSTLLGPSAQFELTQELGLFKEEGIQIKVERAASVGPFIPMLVSGKLDALIGALSPALANSARLGTGVRLVMAREQAAAGCSTFGSIYGRKQSFPNGLHDFSELRGRKLSYTSRGSLVEYAFDMLVEAGGLTEQDVQGVPLRQAEAMAALAAGQLDGVVVSSHVPKAAGALASENALFPGLSRVHPGQQTGFVIFGNELLTAHRERGKAFLRASRRGALEYRKGKTPQAFDRIATENGIDTEAARATCRDTMVADGVVDLAGLERYLDWAFRKKYLEVPVRADSLVDMSLLPGKGA